MNRYLRLFLLAIPWLGTWLVHRRAKAQSARFDALLRDLNDIRLSHIEVRDSELLMALTKDSLAAKIWAQLWQEVIDSVGAPNFLEFKFGSRPDADSWLVVTVQRVPGKTPADKLRNAEAEVARLQSRLTALTGEPEL